MSQHEPSATRRALQGAFMMTASAIGPKRSAQSRSAHGPNPLPILSRTREIVHDVRDLTPRTRAREFDVSVQALPAWIEL